MSGEVLRRGILEFHRLCIRDEYNSIYSITSSSSLSFSMNMEPRYQFRRYQFPFDHQGIISWPMPTCTSDTPTGDMIQLHEPAVVMKGRYRSSPDGIGARCGQVSGSRLVLLWKS